MNDDKKRPAARDRKAPKDASSGVTSASQSGAGVENSFTPPGEMLKQARVAAKLSEQDVARELRMTVTKVRFLEADDYENLHSDTFVRGYLRTYARLLGLDPLIVLSAYSETRRASGWDESEDENPIQVNLREPGRPLWRFAILIIVLLVGLWALSVWFLGNKQDTSAETALIDPMLEMAPQEPASLQPQQPATEQPGGESEPSDNASPDLESGSTTESATEESLTTQATETPVVGPGVEALASTDTRVQTSYTDPEVLDQLRLEFDDECWVEVVDARGDVLQADLLQAGRVLTLSGEAPFDVKIGNAEAVSITLNGEPFAFSVPDNRRTVTLTVN